MVPFQWKKSFIFWGGGGGHKAKHHESHFPQAVARSSRPLPCPAATSVETLFAAAALVAQRQAAQTPRGQATHLAMATWLKGDGTLG